MSKYCLTNPQDIDPEELILIDNRISAIKIDIKDLEEQKAVLRDNPAELKKINDIIKRKEADLIRFKQERKDIIRLGFEKL